MIRLMLQLAQAVVKCLERSQRSPLKLAGLAGEREYGLAVGRRKRREVQWLDLEGRRGNQLGSSLLVALLKTDGVLARQGQRSAPAAAENPSSSSPRRRSRRQSPADSRASGSPR